MSDERLNERLPDWLELPDLAAEAVGGAALHANDEFFAAKENLLRAGDAEWREHEYTDRGKWMDGWESRRRREPGSDVCVVRLGLPGIVRGVVVDTAFFRGNFPESCALDGCVVDGPLDLDGLATAEWFPLVERAKLAGDAKNRFAVAGGRRTTHVRLTIYPDGGVARLRVHGEVVPDWKRQRAFGGPVDLAALEHGGRVLAASDMFFGNRGNLIKPGRPKNMSDGWETKRRRGPGHDWAIVQLGARGAVDRVEIDTTHFKGNAPGRATLEGGSGDSWRPLLDTRLQPHTRHVFAGELRRIGPVERIRLSVFPDGGVARLRVWGVPAAAAVPDVWNAEALAACCGSRRWVEAMLARRPFAHLSAVLRAGEEVWFGLAETDWLEAFAAHPKIGGQTASKLSQIEQAGARGAEEAFAGLNATYLEKHGFIYIVCASGRGADDLLVDLRARIERTRPEELVTAAEEQAKIIRLRLMKLVETERRPEAERSETVR